MKKSALLLLLLVLGSREALTQASVPFVSRLQARAGEAGVLLSWRPVPGFTGTCRIYRHTREIDEASFTEAVEVGTTGAAASAYEDIPPAGGAYFYAVLLDDGKLSRLFIPFRNKTSSPVHVEGAVPEQDPVARVTSLTAEALEDAVRLRFQASRADRELLLFRSLRPMGSAEDLLAAASPVTVGAGSREYEDFPIPGLDYYYALVDAGAFTSGEPQLIDGRNSTVLPVRVSIGAGRVGLPPAAARGEAQEQVRRPATTASAPGRSVPLPFLDLEAIKGLPAPPLPAPRPLGPAATRAMQAALAGAPPRVAPPLQAQALPEDLGNGNGGQGSGLGALVADYLLPGNLPEAEKRLLAFLAARRPETAEARARFYLGQAYYLGGKPDRAVMELLLARGEYYAAVEPWLDACLLALRGR